MVSSFFKLKKNKWLFALAIILFVVMLFDVAAVILNVVQIIQTRTSPTKLIDGFAVFNMAIVLLNVLAILLMVVYIVLKRFTKLKL